MSKRKTIYKFTVQVNLDEKENPAVVSHTRSTSGEHFMYNNKRFSEDELAFMLVNATNKFLEGEQQ